MLPDAIRHYQIEGIIGQGGFATVYLAHDTLLDHRVAIKVLYPHHARNADTREAFLREGRALVRLRNDHLVRVLEAGIESDDVYLVLEYIDGRPLSVVAGNNHPWPLDATRQVIGQVASALDAIHDAGLIHRDVNPSNIMIQRVQTNPLATDHLPRAVLLDLGLARSIDVSSVWSGELLVGTLGYVAPEQFGPPGSASPRTDIYQLAATTYRLLAGRPLYDGEPAQVLLQVSRGQAPSLGLARPDLPVSAVLAVDSALSPNPNERPPRASAFAHQLGGAASIDDLVLPTLPGRRIPVPETGSEDIRRALTAINLQSAAWVAALRASDDSALQDVFTGQALLAIAATIAEHRRQGTYEDHELASISLLSVTPRSDMEMEARTAEHWRSERRRRQGDKLLQRWETRTEQTYRLVNRGGTWLIAEHAFVAEG